jgi:hypothetical protein
MELIRRSGRITRPALSSQWTYRKTLYGGNRFRSSSPLGSLWVTENCKTARSLSLPARQQRGVKRHELSVSVWYLPCINLAYHSSIILSHTCSRRHFPFNSSLPTKVRTNLAYQKNISLASRRRSTCVYSPSSLPLSPQQWLSWGLRCHQPPALRLRRAPS